MAENAPEVNSTDRPKSRHLLAVAVAAFKILLELVGALAALIAILQAFGVWF